MWRCWCADCVNGSGGQLVYIGIGTMSSTGTQADRNQTVAGVASLFGASITENDVIGETFNASPTLPGCTGRQALLKSVLLKEHYSWSTLTFSVTIRWPLGRTHPGH